MVNKDSNTLKEHEKSCDMCQSIIPSRMNEKLIKAIDRSELKDSNTEKGLIYFQKNCMKPVGVFQVSIIRKVKESIDIALCGQKKQIIRLFNELDKIELIDVVSIKITNHELYKKIKEKYLKEFDGMIL